MAQQIGQVSPDGHWVWSGTQWVPSRPPTPAQPPGVPWARAYESGRFRATMATIFLAANVVGLLLLIAFDVVDVAQPTSPASSTSVQVILVGLLALLALVVFLGSYIPAIVFLLMWLHRVVRNMPALGSFDPRWSPSGAVVRCFIPFLNLLHPLGGTLDAWRGSDPSLRWLNVTARRAISAPPVITGWWALWLAGNWIAVFGSGISSSSQVAGAVVEIVGTLLLVGAGVLGILVIRDVTARQDQKNELITSGQLS